MSLRGGGSGSSGASTTSERYMAALAASLKACSAQVRGWACTRQATA